MPADELTSLYGNLALRKIFSFDLKYEEWTLNIFDVLQYSTVPTFLINIDAPCGSYTRRLLSVTVLKSRQISSLLNVV